MSTLGSFFISLVIFLGIDLLWLGVIARPVYHHYMKHLLRDSPNWPVAFLFYAIFVLGLFIIAIYPALAKKDLNHALKMGIFYGFFTYMTYDLTNWAVLKEWPWQIVVVDIAWGTILAMTVAGLSTFILLKIG
jgi:uncharacterized membrane protein